MTPLRSLTLADVIAPTAEPTLTRVRPIAVADLPSRFGAFHVVAFEEQHSGKEHLAVLRGDVRQATGLLTRVHSECLTGDGLGSLRCDCREQLELGLRRIGQQRIGLLLYLRQEGRGIGLINKIRAYALQDRGLDTFDANRALHLGDDERDYGIAADMLQILGVQSVRLLTNNPDKVKQLSRHGVNITAREPHLVPPNAHNRGYLRTKAQRAGHYIPLGDRGTGSQSAELPHAIWTENE